MERLFAMFNSCSFAAHFPLRSICKTLLPTHSYKVCTYKLSCQHHCRRCGGIFCGSCTQQRMVLRGQGDSPVRICEPCKKLKEAARFELRHGRRAGRGSLKSASKDEDEVLNQILGQSREELLSSGKQSTSDKVLSGQRSVGAASSSSTSNYDGDVDLGSTTPDELREQALEEKKKHKILKGEGKSEEALRAFKRGKELERQVNALEIQLRKTRKKRLVKQCQMMKCIPESLSISYWKGFPVSNGNQIR